MQDGNCHAWSRETCANTVIFVRIRECLRQCAHPVSPGVWEHGSREFFLLKARRRCFLRDNPPPCDSAILSDFFWEEASPRDPFNRVIGEGFLHEHRNS